ncbi:tripartite tricarboxylate transporter permease [Treponema sp. HNW]|uniref:tripartite tricarboxylate transporter permease n=1 Tax=Treponema sp. HNW TaxID=3116654 RepID=UPI003D0DB022
MDLSYAFLNVFNPSSLLFILLGVVIGNIFGCIPGLNTPIALALELPFTMVMGRVPSICLIMGTYMGCVSGGLVPATLLRIPGTAASIATTFEGYPMTLKGYGTYALTVGAFASFYGGIFSSFMLLLLSPLLAKFAVGFGPWEYFGATILALTLVSIIIQGRMIKGFIALGLGLLVKTVGTSPVDGVVQRFSLGNMYLENGFNLIAVLIGAFALPEVISSITKLKEHIPVPEIDKRWFHYLPGKDFFRLHGIMLRSSIIGTVVGILPGLGGGPAGMMAYAIAKKTSTRSEEFGTGCDEGIAASESANNATTGGALIPLLALSVPGDTATAVMIGILSIQGIPIGPNLTFSEPILFKTILLVVFIANFFMYLYQGTTLRFMSKVVRVPRMYLLPLIIIFCITGIFCINSNIYDVYFTLGFIILGYILDKNDYPMAPFIMGVVLGPTVEENLRRAIGYYGNFVNCFVQRSVGTLFVIIAIILPLSIGFIGMKKNILLKK